MDSPVITINLKDIKSKSSTKAKNINLDEYIEISAKYVKFFKNCWIKYTDKSSMITYQGGFLVEHNGDRIVLRNIRQETVELQVEDYIFYCKDNTEQYLTVKELMIEKQKLEHQKEIFNKEKREFIEQKRRFFSKCKD